MKKNISIIFGTLIFGMFLGWLLFHSSQKIGNKNETIEQTSKETVWTCAMHPHIRMHEPGKCPICGMELIPLVQNNTPVDADAIHFTKEAAELANVQTSVVTKQKPIKAVRLYGKIQADERLLQNQVAHISGRIEKLMVNFTGEGVRKGQTLALIYSPELVTAQQELLEAAKTKQSQPEIYEAAKEKLQQWKLTDKQIENIESSGNPLKYNEIVADISGIVTTRWVNVGDYVNQGSVLFDIADLSDVWAMFDAYESDLPFLKEGDKLSFEVQAIPGKTFAGNIVFIDPVIDPITRVTKVRVEINNQSGKLKPEMFATGNVNANLSEFSDKIVVPRSAVLWTGKRSIVYVKQAGSDEAIFKIREVELGPMLGSSYIIADGLTEGEEIVTQGAFSVDAAAQLEGKPSMMNRSNEKSEMHVNQSAEFKVSGNCEQCKERIEKAAQSVNGVLSAIWNVDSKKIHIEFNKDKTSSDAIQKAIAKSGHDTENAKADDKTYNNLPDCCKYR